MIQYKKPLWYTTSGQNYSDPIFIENALKEVELFEQENKLLSSAAYVELKKARQIIKDIYGQNSKEFKYLNKMILPQPPSLKMSLNNWIASAQRKQEELTKEAKSKQIQDIQKARTVTATLYLIDNGVPTNGISSINPIEQANELAFELLVKEYTKGDGYHSFGGDDNCENCSGWDGRSHRCNCGNRRVSWEGDVQFDDKNNYIYGQAY